MIHTHPLSLGAKHVEGVIKKLAEIITTPDGYQAKKKE